MESERCGQFVSVYLVSVLDRQMSALSLSLCAGRATGQPQTRARPDTDSDVTLNLLRAPGARELGLQFVLSQESPQLHKSNDNLIPSWWAPATTWALKPDKILDTMDGQKFFVSDRVRIIPFWRKGFKRGNLYLFMPNQIQWSHLGISIYGTSFWH